MNARNVRSSFVRRSRRRGFVDGALNLLLLAPFRCCQCMHRFVRFANGRARRALLIALYAIPLIIGACFGELDARVRVHYQPCIQAPGASADDSIHNELDQAINARLGSR